MMPEQAPVESEFDRAVKHWRWCWDCGARASDCYESQDDRGTKCCPDCRHRNAITQLPAQRDIAEAATALVGHIRHGMKDFTSGIDPVHGRLEDALVAAVEEGQKA